MVSFLSLPIVLFVSLQAALFVAGLTLLIVLIDLHATRRQWHEIFDQAMEIQNGIQKRAVEEKAERLAEQTRAAYTNSSSSFGANVFSAAFGASVSPAQFEASRDRSGRSPNSNNPYASYLHSAASRL